MQRVIRAELTSNSEKSTGISLRVFLGELVYIDAADIPDRDDFVANRVAPLPPGACADADKFAAVALVVL